MKTFAILVSANDAEKKFYLKSFSTEERLTRSNLRDILQKIVKPGYTVHVLRTKHNKEEDFLSLAELICELHELRLYKTQRVFQMVGYNETKCGTLMIMPQGVLPIEGWYSEPNIFIKLKSASDYLKVDMQALADDLNRQDTGFNFKVWNGPTGTGIYATIGYNKKATVEVYEDLVNISYTDYSPKYEWREVQIEL